MGFTLSTFKLLVDVLGQNIEAMEVEIARTLFPRFCFLSVFLKELPLAFTALIDWERLWVPMSSCSLVTAVSLQKQAWAVSTPWMSAKPLRAEPPLGNGKLSLRTLSVTQAKAVGTVKSAGLRLAWESIFFIEMSPAVCKPVTPAPLHGHSHSSLKLSSLIQTRAPW